MTDELKPCFACGRKAMKICNTSLGTYQAICVAGWCNVHGPNAKTKEEAADLWNALTQDRERLDWLERQGQCWHTIPDGKYTRFQLQAVTRETGTNDYPTARQAIDAAMQSK